MNKIISLSLLVLGLLFCSSGADARRKSPLDDSMRAYATAVRWSEWDIAMEYLSPKLLAENPLTELERERLNQIRITGYEEIIRRNLSKTVVEQTVKIRLISVHTQTEREIRDRQRWEYDPQLKRWWLVSGLPDFSQK